MSAYWIKYLAYMCSFHVNHKIYVTQKPPWTNGGHHHTTTAIVQAQVLEHLFEQYLPKSGVVESDRMLLKEVLMSHSEYRAHSGSQDLCWKARLHKSGIEVFSLVEAGLFSKMLFSVPRTVQLLLF